MKTRRHLANLILSSLLATSWAFAAEPSTEAREATADAPPLPLSVAPKKWIETLRKDLGW